MRKAEIIDVEKFKLRDSTEFANFYTFQGINLAMVEFKPGVDIGLEEAKTIVAKVSELLDASKRAYGITKVRSGASANSEAREYFANCNFTVNHTYAMATVFNDLASRLLYNFYLRMQKPRIKNKGFNSIDNALTWIKYLSKTNE